MSQRKVVVVYHSHELTQATFNGILKGITHDLDEPIIHTHTKKNVQVQRKAYFVSTIVLNFNRTTAKLLYVLSEDSLESSAYLRIGFVLRSCGAIPCDTSMIVSEGKTYTNCKYLADVELIVGAITNKSRSDFVVVTNAACN